MNFNSEMKADFCFVETLRYTVLKLISLSFPQQHTDKLNTQVALHQLYQFASKYYDGVCAV